MNRFILKLLIIIVAGFSSCTLLWGLDPGKAVQSYLVDKWEMADGFPSDEITAIVQTADGYLWLATPKGLVRFDGIAFSIVPFTGQATISQRKTDIPNDLYTDTSGKLWIGSTAGLTVYDYRDRCFQVSQPSSSPGTVSDPFPIDRIRRVTGDMNGNLWITFFSSYAGRLSASTFTHYDEKQGLKAKKIDAIVEDHQGNLLFGTKEEGIFIFRDGKFSPYPIAGIDPSHSITAMHEDAQGILWIGTNDGLYKVVNGTAVRYTSKDGLVSPFITVIKEDRRGNLWAASLGGGLFRINKKKDNTVSFEHHFLPLKILCLFEDSEENLWIGTLDAGLRRLKDGKFTGYPALKDRTGEIFLAQYQEPQKGTEDSMNNVAQGTRDRLDSRDTTETVNTWVGTLDGKLFRCRADRIVEIIRLPGFPGTGIAAIAQDAEGRLWLGTNGKGVFMMKENKTFARYTTADGLADNQVNSIFVDSRGRLWIGTVDGLSIAPKPGEEFIGFKEQDELSGKTVHNVYEDSNHNIWVATNQGITVLSYHGFDNHTGETGIKPGEQPHNRIFSLQSFSKNGTIGEQGNIQHFLKGLSVTCIHEDLSADEKPGTLFWAASDGSGLIRLNLRAGADGKVTPYIYNFTTDQGLATNVIYQFFEDKQGYFWMMSNNGILRLSKNELNCCARSEIKRFHCTTFGIQDGMESSEFNNEFSRHSAIETESGELRFVTKKGITVVNPVLISINKTAPPVVMESVYSDREPLYLPVVQQGEKENGNGNRAGIYRVKGTRSFRFFFTAPTFLSPGKVTFEYKLEGYDKEPVFVAPGQERVAYYENLKPGSYMFRVFACNAEGVWNRDGASFAFTVVPLFHQSLLFIILILILAAGALAFLVYIYRKRPFDKKIKPKEQSLDNNFARVCIQKLDHLMQVEKVYRDEKIALNLLAERLSIKPYQLSQLLNENLQRSFPDYINYYRIEEARRILASPQGKEMKMSALALDIGFNTESVFYKAFKKFTGMTPTQYRKKYDKQVL